ncbi:hypothetical protein BABA_15397 [Neobacillus bataviensis LMG 21833]|uniref:Uncharacterized protein n=1 Tax=Neobacillus bataviensis LMG 21833 TaxID=1117379 RepID=K6D215_9BACI|nr:hypothetical protein [Neobacillus bataviensis]EKN66507.1 hypothetical protein BABA_15397 [Neobacillus bataviensis LMG 21833]
MEINDDAANNLEQLLESLIKMVGKANKNVDSLQKRVSQLEWLIRERQLENKQRGPIHIYSRYPHESADKFPIHL